MSTLKPSPFRDPFDPGASGERLASVEEIAQVGEDLTPQIRSSYASLNDAAIAHRLDVLAPGLTEVWYVKVPDPSSGKEGLDRYRDIRWEPDGGVIDLNDLSKTHVLLGSVAGKDPEDLWTVLQGEVWSPKGEARSLIMGSGTAHTSCDLGDLFVIRNEAGKRHAWVVMGIGCKDLGEVP